jgi:predicted ATPase
MQIGCIRKRKIHIMNKIGFQNFRRFQNFEPLEYSGITFLVGRNNAGKSTLVKALLLIDNYFKSRNIDSLSFGNNVLEDANIVTYGRAKNMQAKENFIHFTQKIENFLIELTVSGEDDKAFANIQTLSIIDSDSKLHFVFNLQNRFIKVTKERDRQVNTVTQKIIADLEAQVEETKTQLAEPGLKKTSKEYIELVSGLENLESKLADINKAGDSKVSKNETLFSLDEDFGDVNSLTEIVDGFLIHSISQYEREFQNIQNGEDASERFEDLRALKELDPIFVESSFSHFMTLMNDFSIAYMGANPAKQSALFAIRDKNNPLAQAIHEYKQLNIVNGEEEHRFVLKWMQEFEVGDDFTISMHAGEAYEMKVFSNNTKIHLADKGMGSIQAMLLIMRIACIIKKIKIAEKNSTVTRIEDGKEVSKDSSNYRLIDKTTVIIEEPELNLHPALQSKLADLFLDVHQRFRIDFLIETHSEYILRRSQVLVAENEYEVSPNENPFCVYYFPKNIEQQPYRLEYQKDGSFNRNFGDGFFDEASSSTLELLKLKRQKKA